MDTLLERFLRYVTFHTRSDATNPVCPSSEGQLVFARALCEEIVEQTGLISVPLLGRRPAEQHQRTLAVLLAFGLVVLGAVTFFVLSQTEKVSQQLAASGQALMQSQRLAKSVSQALIGSPAAFPEVRDSSDVLSRSLRGLKQGDTEMAIDALGPEYTSQLDELLPRIDAAADSGLFRRQLFRVAHLELVFGSSVISLIDETLGVFSQRKSYAKQKTSS